LTLGEATLADESCLTGAPPIAERNRSVSAVVHRVQAVILVCGTFLLLALVLTGAAGQAGLQLCAICTGNVCGPGTAVCPGSVAYLEMIVVSLAVASFAIAVGLSESLVARMGGLHGALARNRPGKPAHTIASLPGPFLLFFGWGLIALGLLLPWDLFGNCRDGPCDYPYVLSEYPVLLVIAGGVCLATGIVFFSLLSLRRGNSTSPIGG
jgi:hypothetical protein